MDRRFESLAKHKNIILIVIGVAALASYMIPFEQIFSTADAAKPLNPPGKPAPTCKPPGKYCIQVTPKPKLLLGAELFGLNLS